MRAFSRSWVGLGVGLGMVLLGELRADWPQFLGPERDGVSRDTNGLRQSIGEDGLTRVWSHDLGDGFAGPVVAGNRCFVFHRRGKRAVLDALAADSGDLLWSFDYPTDYVDRFGFDPGPRSSPTVAGNQVFLYGVEGWLHALDATDGSVLWKKNLAESFGAPSGFFGRSSAPLVAGGLVMLDVGGEHEGEPATVLAFDVEDGKLKWVAGKGEADYTSPMLLKVQPSESLGLFFVREGLLGVEVASGKVRFEEAFRSPISASVNAASPVIVGSRFFLSSCYGVGAGYWEWSASDGLRSIYKRDNVLDCHYTTPVHVNGYLYGYHGRQETGQELRCLQLQDGEVQWSKPMPPGSVLVADGKLLILTERGELVVGELNPGEWKVLFREQVTGAETRALPALANGLFYARDKKRLVCIDLRARE